jgi:type II secretory pathway component GspD/PulD (secretin)
VQFVQQGGKSAAPQAPPVNITVTPDGRLVISSSDTKALDQLQELIDRLSAPRRDFEIFRLNYVSASLVSLNLEEYFADELEAESDDGFRDWYFGFDSRSSEETPLGLSRRRKLRIIYDTPSNSILVAGASQSQLQEIRQLIAEYDRPVTVDSIKARRTEAIKIRYSRAKTIADALKEVYRDLLSSKDKEFDANDKKSGGTTRETTTIIRYGSSSAGGGNKKTPPVKVGFEGALSIGIDEIANMLIISAQEEIFESVVEMVHRLDQEAKPKTTVAVHRINGGVRADALQKALSEALGTPWPGGRPEKEEQPAEGDQEAKKKNGENQARAESNEQRPEGESD